MITDYRQEQFTKVDTKKLQEQRNKELAKKILEDSKEIARHATAKISGVDVIGDIPKLEIVVTVDSSKKKDDDKEE